MKYKLSKKAKTLGWYVGLISLIIVGATVKTIFAFCGCLRNPIPRINGEEL